MSSYEGMTAEQLLEELNARDLSLATRESELKELQTAHADLTAERNSFETELKDLKASHAQAQEELRKTKELNFTLGRQVNDKNAVQDTETLIHDMFNPHREKGGKS